MKMSVTTETSPSGYLRDRWGGAMLLVATLRVEVKVSFHEYLRDLKLNKVRNMLTLEPKVFHAGQQINPEHTGFPPVGSSEYVVQDMGECSGISIDEIENIEEEFVEWNFRFFDVGFDFVISPLRVSS